MDPQPETSKRISRPAGACQAEPERFVFKSVPHPSGARPFSCSPAVGRGWPRTDHTMRELPGGRRTPQSPAPGAQTPWNSPAMREFSPDCRPRKAAGRPPCRTHAATMPRPRTGPVLAPSFGGRTRFRSPRICEPLPPAASPPSGPEALDPSGRSSPAGPSRPLHLPSGRPPRRSPASPKPRPPTGCVRREAPALGQPACAAALPAACLPGRPPPLPPAAARPAEAPDSGLPSHRVTPSSCRPSLRQHTGNSADATSTRSNSSPSPRTAALSSLIRPKIRTSRTCAWRPICMGIDALRAIRMVRPRRPAPEGGCSPQSLRIPPPPAFRPPTGNLPPRSLPTAPPNADADPCTEARGAGHSAAGTGITNGPLRTPSRSSCMQPTDLALQLRPSPCAWSCRGRACTARCAAPYRVLRDLHLLGCPATSSLRLCRTSQEHSRPLRSNAMRPPNGPPRLTHGRLLPGVHVACRTSLRRQTENFVSETSTRRNSSQSRRTPSGADPAFRPQAQHRLQTTATCPQAHHDLLPVRFWARQPPAALSLAHR